MKHRKHKARTRHPEFDPNGESDQYFAVIIGKTSGGFSYGVTWEEWWEMEAEDAQIKMLVEEEKWRLEAEKAWAKLALVEKGPLSPIQPPLPEPKKATRKKKKKKKKKKKNVPKRYSFKRQRRLASARAWLPKYTGKNLIGGYRKRFRVDRICALTELKMLGVKFSEAEKAKIHKAQADHLRQVKLRKERKKAKQQLQFDPFVDYEEDSDFFFEFNFW